MASTRPTVSVQSLNGDVVKSMALPSVFSAPIRPDIAQFVHTNMNKNKRQAYAPSKTAGEDTSATSWGTGRALARIPRVKGGGTSASGSGAFGNMCRGGRMFAPNKTWRKWHRKVNVKTRRYATVSAVAASAVPALVMARGHKIEQIPEVPLVISNEVESLSKTKDAVALLNKLQATADVEHCKNSRQVRSGKGKMRNRRHVMRRGPLVVYNKDDGITKAFRNLPGVELCSVERLNLLQLAPGGHLGRFVIWTEAAFERLESIYGSKDTQASEKKGYTLPRDVMANADLGRIINSNEVQSVLRPKMEKARRSGLKKNPLKNIGTMLRLNPYALEMKKQNALAEENNRKAKEARKTSRKERIGTIRASKKAFAKSLFN